MFNIIINHALFFQNSHFLLCFPPSFCLPFPEAARNNKNKSELVTTQNIDF